MHQHPQNKTSVNTSSTFLPGGGGGDAYVTMIRAIHLVVFFFTLMDSSTGYGMESTTTHVTGTFFLFETVVLRVDVAVIGAKNQKKNAEVVAGTKQPKQRAGGAVYEAEI